MRQRSILLVFMLLMATLPAFITVSADEQPLQIDTFANGSQSIGITLIGGTNDVSTAIELDRNITVQDASFNVQYLHSDDSPGQIWLDIDEDGYKEWAFEGPGNGDLGQQITFSNGSTWATTQYDNMSQQAPEFYLPFDATMQYSYLNATFESDFGDGFYSLGHIADIANGDVDADQNEEAILLSHDSSITGFDAAISFVDWSPTSGIVFSPWVETCNQATELTVADVNGDGKADVAAISLMENKLCLHLYNKMTGDFTPSANTTLDSSTVKAELSDADDDGSADIISIRSDGKLELRKWASSGFDSPSSTEIFEEGSAFTLAVLTDLRNGMVYGQSHGDYHMVQDQDSNWRIYNYSTSQGTMNEISSFNGIEENTMIVDLDGDGDLDAFGNSSSGFVIKENKGFSGWSGSTISSQMDLTNASIFDYDGDGFLDLLTVNEKAIDNNSATIEGNFSVRTFANASSISASLPITLKPGSMPGQAMAIDLDGDGNVEHFVPVGESDQGLFIGAWHRIGLDIDNDGSDDIDASGYARSAADGLPMLTLTDDDHRTALILDSVLKGGAAMPDMYGNELVSINLDLNSTINGTFNFTSLNLGYDIELTIRINPNPSGNLTNALNQGVARLPGTFTTNLSFNSTKAGSITISDLIISYHPGAPELFIPPLPILTTTLVSPFTVGLQWNDMAEYNANLLEFHVYRSVGEDPLDSDQPTFVVNTNSFSDEDVIVDSNYHYAVRSIHEGGVRSNLSNIVDLTIPYPTPPAPLSSIFASDVAGDDGGALAITWGHSSAILLDSYQIYLETSNFSQISNLTPIETLVQSVNSTTITGLVDGTPYWLAVIAVDSYGNFSDTIIASGPYLTRNDTAQSLTLSVDTAPIMALGSPFWIDVSSKVGDETSDWGTVTIILTQGEFTWVLAENAEPNIKLTYGDLSEMGEGIESLYGDINITVIHTGYEGNTAIQPLLPASLIINKTILIEATLSTTLNPFLLNLFDQGEIHITLNATNSQHNGLMENIAYEWTVLNLEGGLVESGSGIFTSSSVDIAVEVDGGGVLNVMLVTPDWLIITPSQLMITLTSSNQEVVEDDSWSPSAIGVPTFNCLDLVLAVDDNTAADLICTVANTNNYSILIEFNLDGWTIHDEIDFTPKVNSISLEANQSSELVLSISITNLSTLGTGQYYATITGTVSTDDYPDSNDLIISTKILWAIGEEVKKEEENVADNYTTPVISSQSMTTLYVSSAVIVVVAGLIWVLMIALRRKRDNEDTWSEDELEMDEAPVSYSDEKRVSKPLPVGMGLEEIRYEGESEIDRSVPQNRDHSLFAEAEGRDHLTESDDEDHTIDYSEDEDSSEEDSGGITTDEDGTEWYEDEVGVWWYREQGMDDWAEFHEQ